MGRKAGWGTKRQRWEEKQMTGKVGDGGEGGEWGRQEEGKWNKKWKRLNLTRGDALLTRSTNGNEFTTKMSPNLP